MAVEPVQGTVTERIRLREKLAYSLGDVASNVVWSGVGAFATYYYTNSAGLAAGAVGTMFLISRIFDGISDILMGLVIDRTRSKYGKARPWLLWMALPFGIAAVLLFSVPQSWGPGAKLVYAYITYNLLATLVYTAINLAYGTMTALITDDSRDRTLLNIFRMVGAIICALAVNMIIMPMVQSFGGGPGAWQITFSILSIAAVVLFFLCFLGTKERVGSSTKKEDAIPVKIAVRALLKNKYWYLLVINSILLTIGNQASSGANIYFAKYALGDETLVGLLALTSAAPMFIALFFMAPLAQKLGKRNLVFSGSLVSLVGMAVQCINPASMVLILVGNIIRGLGLSGTTAVGFVMIADAIDYGEWKTGVRTEGLVYSASSFGGKVGTGLGSAALGWALAIGAFNPSLEVQAAPAMTAILSAFLYIPILLTVLSLIVLSQYKLDKELPHILADLRRRHQPETVN
jgi:GPH family glycoside/pentoside/hexuronide:cation symporter